MSGLLTDLRGAVRMLRRRQAIALLIVCTLALGIGANTVIFAMTRGILLRPLPYTQPDDLVMLWRAPRDRPAGPLGFGVDVRAMRQIATPSMVRGWRQGNRTLTDLAAAELWQGNLSAQMDLISADTVQRLRGAFVTPNFFSVLGVEAAHGRTFAPADGDAVVVLSDGLWRRQFGGDPAVVGQTVDLTLGRARVRQRRPVTVIGVLPPRFRFTYPEDTEIWTVLPWQAVDEAMGTPFDDALLYWTIARLRPGVAAAQAEADLNAILEAREAERGRTRGPLRNTVRVEPMHEYAVGRVRSPLALLGGVTAVVLAIACLSVATLLLAQAASRRRDIVLQRALGASRLRIARQLLTECALMGIIAAAAAVAAVAALQPIIRSVLPASTPRGDEIGVDLATIGWTTLVATFTVMVAGLVPSWRSASTDPNARLIGSGATTAEPASLRLRQTLIAAQVALVSTLLVAGALLLHSFWKLQQVDLGFDGDRVLTAEMRLVGPRYQEDARVAVFQEELLSRLRAVPGVMQVSMTSAVPFRGVDWLRSFPRGDGSGGIGANERQVDPDYFEVMRIQLLAGRLFARTDTAAAPPVAVVSQSFARALFGDGEALGKSLPGFKPPVQIVGIVGDVRTQSIDAEARPAYYLPRAQAPSELICLVIRTASESQAIAGLIPGVVRSIDPEQPVEKITTLDRIVSESIADRRFYAVATTAFAIITLLLAAAGVCGVLAQAVTDRTRELGVRAAIGATPGDQIRAILMQGMTPIALGLCAGAIGAFWVTRLLRQFLFQISDFDLVAHTGAVVAVGMVGLLACYLPARRASRLDVVNALRHE